MYQDTHDTIHELSEYRNWTYSNLVFKYIENVVKIAT